MKLERQILYTVPKPARPGDDCRVTIRKFHLDGVSRENERFLLCFEVRDIEEQLKGEYISPEHVELDGGDTIWAVWARWEQPMLIVVTKERENLCEGRLDTSAQQ